MTEPKESQTINLQIHPKIEAQPGQATLFVNTFGSSVAQNLMYLEFAVVTPQDIGSVTPEANASGTTRLEVPVYPLVRLVMPVEAAAQLRQALDRQLQAVQAQGDNTP